VLAQQNPDQLKHILANNPQLAYSLLQAQVSLGLADANAVQVWVAYFLASKSVLRAIEHQSLTHCIT